MADLSITAANVDNVETGNANTERGIAGATITAGQAVYRDASDSNQFKLADNDAAGTDDVYGIALNSASDEQPLVVQRSGTIDMGGVVAVGTIYVLSSTAGGVAPSTDLVSTDYVTVIGVGVTATNIELSLLTSGVQVP